MVVKMVNSIYRQCSLITCQAPFKGFCMHRLINLHYDSSLLAIGFWGLFSFFLFFFFVLSRGFVESWSLNQESNSGHWQVKARSPNQWIDREFPPLAIVFFNLQMQKLKQRDEVTCPISHSQKEGS